MSSIILNVQHSFIHRVFLSTDYHRFTQIFLISKDIVIITDFLFGTEIHGFIFNKDTAWLRIDITTALRDYGLLAQVRGLVCFAVTSRVYTLV